MAGKRSATERQKAFKRDEGECQKCGTDKHIEVHHVKPIAAGGDDLESNMISLCTRCHDEWHYLCDHIPYDFDVWITLPPFGVLLRFYFGREMWPDDLSARAFRDQFDGTWRALLH